MLSLHYLVEFAKLYIVVFYIFNIPKKRSVWLLNLVIVSSLLFVDIWRLLYFDWRLIGYHNDVYIYAGLSLIVMLYVVNKPKFLPILIVIHFLSSFIDLIISGFFITALSIDIQIIAVNPFYRVMVTLPSVLLLTITAYAVKRLNLKIDDGALSRKEMNLITISLLALGFYVVSLQTVEGQFANLMVTVGGFAVICIILTLILKDNRFKKAEDLRIIQEEILVQQQSYHEAFLEREEETRKFRHDITHHFNCMSQLIEEKKYLQLENYFANLNDDIFKIQSYIGTDTGSSVVNAILFSLKTQYNDEDVDVKWIGVIPKNMRIPDKDIAMLFMNLLTNAFEATSVCLDDKRIEIRIDTTDSSFYLMVKNNYAGGLIIENEKIKTSKKDQRNHGYGLQIVKDVVKKYNGQIHFSNDKNVFGVEITFSGEIYLK